MQSYYSLMGRVHSSLSVDVPKPKAPDSGDILDKGNDGASWLAGRSNSFWTIVVILVVALILGALMKRPMIKGLVIGVILLGVVLAIVNNV